LPCLDDLDCIVGEKSIERQTFWQNEISYVISSDGQLIKGYGGLPFGRHFNIAQMSVHSHVNT
jgi:hypothetical protein